MVIEVETQPLPPLPARYSSGLRNAIRSCLKVNPKLRPTASELLNLPRIQVVVGDYALVRGRRDSYKRETVFGQQQRVMEEQETLQGFLIHDVLCVTINERHASLSQ